MLSRCPGCSKPVSLPCPHATPSHPCPRHLPAHVPQLTLLDLSFNSLRSIKPGEYLKRLVVSLACQLARSEGACLLLGPHAPPAWSVPHCCSLLCVCVCVCGWLARG